MRKGQIYQRCEICKKPLSKVTEVHSHGFQTKDLVKNHPSVLILGGKWNSKGGSACSIKCMNILLESLKFKDLNRKEGKA